MFLETKSSELYGLTFSFFSYSSLFNNINSFPSSIKGEPNAKTNLFLFKSIGIVD